MDDVMSASKQVMQFCKDKGMEGRKPMLTSLFIEERVGNTVKHGFTGKHPGSIDLRVVYSPDSLVIRLRDNGTPFDPVEWLKCNRPEDPASGAGIRIIVGLAKEVTYIPAMGRTI